MHEDDENRPEGDELDWAGLSPTQEPGGGESPPQAPPVSAEPEVPEPTGPSRQPKLGNTVHFVLPVGPNQGQDRLAIVSFVYEGEGDGPPDNGGDAQQQGLVDLHIFGLPVDHPNVTSTHLVRFAQRVPYSQQRRSGTWHWPGEAGE
jgi:hypothetical protein